MNYTHTHFHISEKYRKKNLYKNLIFSLKMKKIYIEESMCYSKNIFSVFPIIPFTQYKNVIKFFFFVFFLHLRSIWPPKYVMELSLSLGWRETICEMEDTFNASGWLRSRTSCKFYLSTFSKKNTHTRWLVPCMTNVTWNSRFDNFLSCLLLILFSQTKNFQLF